MFKKIVSLCFVVTMFFVGVSNAYAEVVVNDGLYNCELNGKLIPCDQLPSWFVWFQGFMVVFIGLCFVVVVISIISLWKIFVKAGKPGWASIIPFYNVIVLLQITNKPLWWIILMFIPIVNIVITFIVYYQLVKCFGKGTGFYLGVMFLPFIFIPILGFGKSVYRGSEMNMPNSNGVSNTPSNNPMQTPSSETPIQQ